MNVLESKRDRQYRVLNPRAAVIVGVTAVVFLFGMRKLHDRQFGRTIEFLRQSAYAALDASDYRKAQMGLNQYLAFRSSDMDARQKLSTLLSTHIRTRPALEQAFQLNEDLLRNDLPQQELRLEQSRIAVKLNRCSDARAHLQILQKLREDSSEIWYLSAHCAREARKMDEAARWYQRALSCPNPPEAAFEELAELAAANPHLMLDPENILDQMVTTCNSAAARRLRAIQLVEKRQFAEALSHVWKGLEAAPDDVPLNAILVSCLQRINRPALPHHLSPQNHGPTEDVELVRGIRHLQACVERNPAENSFRIDLAALLWKNQQQPAAIQVLEAGISRKSRGYQLHGVLIDYLLTQEQGEKAEQLLQTLPANALFRSERELLTGRCEMLRKDWKAADASLQRAVAYSESDSGLQQRAEMMLAICRSNSGDVATAVDAFRTILAAAPDSVAGRLGMASAWMKAGRKDLAIAEYRHLLEIPGVPAFLTDLIIQRNLELPAGLREWNEIADLVRDENPRISDSTQRTLLQTDVLMASGRVTEAIAGLERASASSPANAPLQRALARLNGPQSGGLQHRLQQLASNTPEDHNVLATLVRLKLNANEAEEALAMLDRIANGHSSPHLNAAGSLLLAVRTTQRIISLETLPGRTQYLELFREAQRRYAGQLSALSPEFEATLVQVLAQQGQAQEALKRVKSIDASRDPAVKISALMALVQYASPRQRVLPDAMRELLAMINAAPNNIALRICYADLLIYGDHFAIAAQVLEQIQNAPPDTGEVAARQAWLLAVTAGSLEKATSLIAHAISMQPQNPAFRVMQGRVLLAEGNYPEVLSVLNGLDEQPLSQAALTYKAAALLEMQEVDEAWRTVEKIRVQDIRDPMFPADERMLQTIQNRLSQFMTASNAQP